MNRKERVNTVLQILKENNGKMAYGKLFGAWTETTSMSKATFDRYLDELKTMEKISYPAITMFGREDEMQITLKDSS